MMLYDAMDFASEAGSLQKSYIPGCASFEMRTPHPQHSPMAESTSREPSEATASKHRSLHSVRVRVKVGVRVGWSASGATAKSPYMYMYPVLYTWYQAFRYIVGIVVAHFIVGSFQTHTPGCAYNTTRILLSSLRICVCVLEFWSRRGCMRR